MISIDEEFRFRLSLAGSDCRSVELVKDPSFSLRLSIKSIAPARLGKFFESITRNMSQPEECIIWIMRATYNKKKFKSGSILKK